MSAVAFDYAVWIGRYPEFARDVTPAAASGYFVEAALYCDNTDRSPVRDLTQRAALLNMVVAHVAALNAPRGGQPAPPLVGRISGAGEGSVNLQTTFDAPQGTPQWWLQTRYGAAFYAATAHLRTFRYMPYRGRAHAGYRNWPSLGFR